MKIIVQRSLKSSVLVNKEIINEISHGLVLLVCVEKSDDDKVIEKAVNKILKLRIFEDDDHKMNKNIIDSKGELLCISQFTLSWDGKKGNRPSFSGSMPPGEALNLFDKFCTALAKQVLVKKGAFGEDMLLSIENDGPVTFSLCIE